MDMGRIGKRRWSGATYASSKCVLQCEASGIADEYGACFIGEL